MAFTSDDVLYCAMPLFHGNALLANLFPAIVKGATVVLRPRFSASAFLPDVRRIGCTYFNYVGRALSYVLAVPERPTTPTTRSGGASARRHRRATAWSSSAVSAVSLSRATARARALS